VGLDTEQLNNFILSPDGHVKSWFDPFIFMGRDGQMPRHDTRLWTVGFDASTHPRWAKLLKLGDRGDAAGDSPTG
jgi:hypothetical protein